MFVALVSAYLLSQFYRAFLSVVAADVMRDLALDAAALGRLSAVWLLAFAAAQFPVGLALDRFGPRRTLAFGQFGAVAGAAWFAAARSGPEATAAMALIGLGCSPVLMAGFYVIARTYPVGQFATMSSILLGLGSLGDPLSGAPLAYAAGAIGWRGTIAAMAALTLVSALAVALTLRDPPVAPAPGRRTLLSGLREIASRRTIWPLLPFAFISYASVLTVRGLWIAPYLATTRGFDPAEQGGAATAMGLALAAGALLYAPLNRFLRSPKLTASFGGGVTGAALLALGMSGAWPSGVAVALFIAIGLFGSSYAIIMAQARSFMPTHLIGVGVTFMNLVFMGGAGVTQWLSGRYVRAAELAGFPPRDIFSTLFGALGAAFLAALAVYVLFAPRAQVDAT